MPEKEYQPRNMLHFHYWVTIAAQLRSELIVNARIALNALMDEYFAEKFDARIAG